MRSKSTKSWKAVRGQKPLNHHRVATYERLMDAEERIADARCRRGESPATIAEALALSELKISEVERDDDLYLRVLARYVAALGGHLEVLAVFPEETIAVRREPDHQSKPDPGDRQGPVERRAPTERAGAVDGSGFRKGSLEPEDPPEDRER